MAKVVQLGNKLTDRHSEILLCIFKNKGKCLESQST